VQKTVPHAITQYKFLALVCLLLGQQRDRTSRIRKPLSVLKRWLDTESDGLSRGRADGEIESEKICISSFCLVPSALFLLPFEVPLASCFSKEFTGSRQNC